MSPRPPSSRRLPAAAAAASQTAVLMMAAVFGRGWPEPGGRLAVDRSAPLLCVSNGELAGRLSVEMTSLRRAVPSDVYAECPRRVAGGAVSSLCVMSSVLPQTELCVCRERGGASRAVNSLPSGPTTIPQQRTIVSEAGRPARSE